MGRKTMMGWVRMRVLRCCVVLGQCRQVRDTVFAQRGLALDNMVQDRWLEVWFGKGAVLDAPMAVETPAPALRLARRSLVLEVAGSEFGLAYWPMLAVVLCLGRADPYFPHLALSR